VSDSKNLEGGAAHSINEAGHGLSMACRRWLNFKLI
jgi:hypothetical protein